MEKSGLNLILIFHNLLHINMKPMAGRLILIIFIAYSACCNLSGQSLEKQFADYFGEVKSESQYKESGPISASLPPYDKNALREAFEDSDSITFDKPTLTALFTYKFWQNLSIRDRSNLDEFHGIQRTFNAGETVRIVWSYGAIGANKLGLSIFTFTLKVFNFDTGEVIASKRYRCEYGISSLDRLWNYYTVSLGNKIPPGNYRFTLHMERAFQVKPSDISFSFLSERFEVLPTMPQNKDMFSMAVSF